MIEVSTVLRMESGEKRIRQADPTSVALLETHGKPWREEMNWQEQPRIGRLLLLSRLCHEPLIHSRRRVESNPVGHPIHWVLEILPSSPCSLVTDEAHRS